MESWSLRIFLVSLGVSSMHLGVPFIAPRQLGAVGDNLGRLILPSVEWRTGQSGAPFRPFVRATCRPPFSLPTVAQSTVGSPDSPVHHRTVRWILAIRRWTFSESDDFAADDSPDSPVHHRTVRWIIAVRCRRVPRAAGSPWTRLAHWTLSGAPPDSAVHPDRAAVGCTQPTLFHSIFFCF
jgi:hypothetical protein